MRIWPHAGRMGFARPSERCGVGSETDAAGLTCVIAFRKWNVRNVAVRFEVLDSVRFS